MKLNRTGNALNRNTRNRDNENWAKLEKKFNDLVGAITEEVFNKIIDGSKFDWINMVDTLDELPSNPEEGTAVGVIENNTIYRYNGSEWISIQKINLNPIAEVDDRLSSQLADTDKQRFFSNPANAREPGLLVSYVDDDGQSGVYTKLFPLAQEYGIPITSALITSRLDGRQGYLTEGQRKEMHESGYVEFVSHTHNHDVNHRPDDMTEEELDIDFSTSQKIMREKGYNHNGVVLPFGDMSDKVIKTASRYFDYTIGTGSAGRGSPQYPGEIDNHYIWRVSVQNGKDFVEGHINDALERGGPAWIVLVGHVDQGGWYTESYMRSIIEMFLNKGFEFVTTQEGFNRTGNIIQFGDKTSVGADGDVYGEKLGRVQYRPRSKGVSHETPITDFPKNVISFTDINTPNATNFPGGLAGILYTHRYDVSTYARQVYIVTRSNRTFTRTWNEVNKEWNEWANTDTVQYLGKNAIELNDPPLLIELQNKISYTQIDSSSNEGFPENKSGLLINYAHEFGTTFPYQEYQLFREPRTFRRYWVNSSWTKWQEIGGTSTLPLNSVNGLTPLSNFDLGITKTWINSNGDRAGLPDSRSGTLITYKQNDSSTGFNYQEFVAFESWDKYIRYATSSGWSDWKKFVVE